MAKPVCDCITHARRAAPGDVPDLQVSVPPPVGCRGMAASSAALAL